MKSNLDMASESSFKCKSPDDNEITTYLGHIPHALLWAVLPKPHYLLAHYLTSSCLQMNSFIKGGNCRENHLQAFVGGPWGTIQKHRGCLRITQDWTLNCKYVQNHRGVPSRGQSGKKKKKIPNNLVMAYSSLELCVSISVKLRSLCSPGFPHPRDPELLKALGYLDFPITNQPS